MNRRDFLKWLGLAAAAGTLLDLPEPPTPATPATPELAQEVMRKLDETQRSYWNAMTEALDSLTPSLIERIHAETPLLWYLRTQ